MGDRLLWLTETYPPSRGGMAESCDRIVLGLRQAGVAVDVAHLSRHAARPRRQRQQNGILFTHPSMPDAAHALATLWNRVEDAGPYSHVVAFGGALPLQAGPVYAAWLGAPLLVLLRGNEFDVGVFSPGRQGPLLRALRRAACVCAVSQDKARRAAALCPGLAVAWTPNGIDLERFTPLPSQRAQAEALRAQAGGRRVLGLLGQIKRKKGALELIEALLGSGEAARFHLLCVGELDEEVRALLEAARGELSATLEPTVDRYELLGRYPACDLVALPSHYDGTPNVLLEAAALSIPLLSSTAGGMGDLLREGEHGFLFHPGDDRARREAVRRAAAAPDDALRRMGAACRALVSRRLSAAAETARYLEVIERTRGAPRGAAPRRETSDETDASSRVDGRAAPVLQPVPVPAPGGQGEPGGPGGDVRRGRDAEPPAPGVAERPRRRGADAPRPGD